MVGHTLEAAGIEWERQAAVPGNRWVCQIGGEFLVGQRGVPRTRAYRGRHWDRAIRSDAGPIGSAAQSDKAMLELAEVGAGPAQFGDGLWGEMAPPDENGGLPELAKIAPPPTSVLFHAEHFDGPAEAIRNLKWVPSDPKGAATATSGSATGLKRSSSGSVSGLVGSCTQLIEDGKRILSEALETYAGRQSNQGLLMKNLLRRKQARMMSEASPGNA